MALFVVILRDIADNADIRSRLLSEHMAHISQHMAAIRLGGPWLRGTDAGPGGGLLLVEETDIDAVRQMIDNDPYYRAGLWEDVQIHPFRDLINAWRDGGSRPEALC